MLKKIFVCDICKKEIDYSFKSEREYSQGGVFLKPKNNRKYFEPESLSLCEACYNDIAKHIDEMMESKVQLEKMEV